MKPITPAEVGRTKGDLFPPFIIQAFNELIAANFSNGSATVKQDDVIERAYDLTYPNSEPNYLQEAREAAWRKEVFAKGWLNVEEIYHNAGWEAKYDKPGYNETYPATFIFSTKTK